MTPREELEMWQYFINQPAWKQIKQWVQEQTAARTAVLIQGGDSTREEDKLRGEILGMNLFMQYPETLVETLQVELDSNQEDQHYGDE